MRILFGIALMTLLVTSNGCSSSSSAQNAIVIEEPGAGVTVFALEQLNSSQVIFVGTSDTGIFDDFEPWVSDGTEAGTRRVLDINPGTTGSIDLGVGGTYFVVIDDIAYFVANDGINGPALWSSDGTETGTVLEAVLLPSSVFFEHQSISAAGDTIFVGGLSTELDGDPIDRHLFSITLD